MHASHAGLACPASALALSPVGSVILWLGVLFVAVLIGGFALIFFRRVLLDADESRNPAGFDLRSLRELRDRGEITEEEFEIARAEIIGALSGEKPTRPPPAHAPTPKADEVTSTPETGEVIRAKPGYDLTGEPLPDFDEDIEDNDDTERPKK